MTRQRPRHGVWHDFGKRSVDGCGELALAHLGVVWDLHPVRALLLDLDEEAHGVRAHDAVRNELLPTSTKQAAACADARERASSNAAQHPYRRASLQRVDRSLDCRLRKDHARAGEVLCVRAGLGQAIADVEEAVVAHEREEAVRVDVRHRSEERRRAGGRRRAARA